jgi:hypothetical protein
MKKKQIIIIAIIILLLAYFLPTLSFTKNYYVDFPQGFRPYHLNYGETDIPLVVEHGEYAHWKIEMTLSPPSGSPQSVTFYPTTNHPDTKHPSNWLQSGPFYISIPFSPDVMDCIGLYTITKLDLWATPISGDQSHIDYAYRIDYIDPNEPVARRQVHVKYASDMIYTITPSSTAIEDGEPISVDVYIKNQCLSWAQLDYCLFVDKNHNGEYDPTDRDLGSGWKDMLGPGAEIIETIPCSLYYSETINGELWLSMKINSYDTVSVWGFSDIINEPISINEPSFFCSAGGPYESSSKTVNFKGSTTGGSSPFAYLWDFGDGKSSTLQNPSHTYEEEKTYEVTLHVTDSVERATIDTTTVTITHSLPGPGLFLFIVAIYIILKEKRKK